ncbi:HAD-IA family hydrolase [Puniceibacterium sp. IMCC21224]|uniref:HAD-IA family hydrolase n=1 Tax=Puniceibacterium sp. IMCC21224 TaxID=1618204 RepID=UPI00064DD45C|nr:HAD-IA family hydrolase [Puniceibacterium sp. IMCC21224]KMK68232.1 haloacid dehalogenase superfamily enzyme, subfamily IA [Puniceibacterium sp. IMCC21224]
MSDLRLVVFDVDGTLVDSQADILAAMQAAFDGGGLEMPSRDAVLGIVGLSLPEAMSQLVPGIKTAERRILVDGYKAAYMTLRADNGVAVSSPLYPHVRNVLDGLHAVPEVLLGVATGKSRRGLDKLLDGHDLRSLFVTQQVADNHPSKPHPGMLRSALSETGIEPHRAVMIGDTSYDMEMARAAGMLAIGVTWGYHDRARLREAHVLLDDIRMLPGLLQQIWEQTA